MASNEIVMVLGIPFAKDDVIDIGKLQRDEDGTFYGISYENDEIYLDNLKPYLNGGEKYIDYTYSALYIFNKKADMWIGVGKSTVSEGSL